MKTSPRIPNFQKSTNGLLPAIIQDTGTGKVLMLGYMNEQAYKKTLTEGKVTFYSRSKERIWTKGEQSGNYLLNQEILVDCDADALLIKVQVLGSICHTGTGTCWGENNTKEIAFLSRLEQIIQERKTQGGENSYVAQLFKKGLNKVAQKVGEEAVECIIEVKEDHTQRFLEEAADLLFHYLILLQAKGHRLQEVIQVLEQRQRPS
ncbi:MAG: bifunctional phosphoribosyl-AMP cyclohydrolase/phosphoribosyl-ATP diphosphatase HisIE [Flavobacteriales bacterium AspAUS03]